MEHWLAERFYPAEHFWFGPTRLLRFRMPPAQAKVEAGTLGAVFGEFARLDDYEVKCAGDGLYITPAWGVIASTPISYTVSVQGVGWQRSTPGPARFRPRGRN